MKRTIFRLGGRRRTVAAFLLLVVMGGIIVTAFLNTQQASAAWWNGEWYYRRKITFNNAASSDNLLNFPVRVSLSSSNINYAHTMEFGDDLRFVDNDDSTVLDYEIETWDDTGTSELWVEVPQIDATSTTDFIWMYYGNADADVGENPDGVWSNGYAGVWHMKENPSVTNCLPSKEVCDSTISNNHADSNGAMVSGDQVPGRINGGIDFDGANDNLQVDDSSSLDITGEVTMSAWVYRNTDPAGYETIAIKESASAVANYALQLDTSNRIDFSYALGGIYTEFVSTATLNTGTWYYVAATYNDVANQVRLYINGALDSTHSAGGSIAANTQLLIIGDSRTTGNEPWSGIIDEFQLSSATRSPEWIEASYISGTNAMNSFGTEEQYPPDPPILTAPGNSTPLQPTFQLRSADRTEPNYLRYKIEVCATSDCSSIIRTIDQTSSQTGWSGQDTQSGTAYLASSTVTGSTVASHTYQAPALSLGTQYWWRAYAIDPGGSNAWSEVSDIGSFITTGPPAAPTLVEPADSGYALLAPMLRLSTTDPNADYVRYKIEICLSSDCSVIVRTIDQTLSQIGWTAQDASGVTAYSTNTTTAALSQTAVHVYQSPLLSGGTQYWWRAYAIDPGGYDQWSPASSIYTFTVRPSNVKLEGGSTIRGGTKIGQ